MKTSQILRLAARCHLAIDHSSADKDPSALSCFAVLNAANSILGHLLSDLEHLTFARAYSEVYDSTWSADWLRDELSYDEYYLPGFMSDGVSELQSLRFMLLEFAACYLEDEGD